MKKSEEERLKKRRKSNKKWRDNNKDHIKEYGKIYREKNKEKINKRLREYFRKHLPVNKQSKEYIKNYMKEYMKDEEKHRKYLVRQRDYFKLRKRLIAEFKACQKCNSKLNLEVHHEDYFKEGEVLILCRKCHRRLHRIK